LCSLYEAGIRAAKQNGGINFGFVIWERRSRFITYIHLNMAEISFLDLSHLEKRANQAAFDH